MQTPFHLLHTAFLHTLSFSSIKYKFCENWKLCSEVSLFTNYFQRVRFKITNLPYESNIGVSHARVFYCKVIVRLQCRKSQVRKWVTKVGSSGWGFRFLALHVSSNIRRGWHVVNPHQEVHRKLKHPSQHHSSAPGHAVLKSEQSTGVSAQSQNKQTTYCCHYPELLNLRIERQRTRINWQMCWSTSMAINAAVRPGNFEVIATLCALIWPRNNIVKMLCYPTQQLVLYNVKQFCRETPGLTCHKQSLKTGHSFISATLEKK